MKVIGIICFILVLVGALNWGLVGAFHFNLVEFMLGPTLLTDIVYILVGIAAIVLIILSPRLHRK